MTIDTIDTIATWHQVAKNQDVEGQYLSAGLLIFFNDSFNYVRELHAEG